jgi:putative redox protein
VKAKVSWQGSLSFSGTADSGFSIPLDAKAASGGDEDGFRPMELIAIGLAGCTAMDVISILQKKRQDVTAFNVQVDADRAEDHPKVFTSAVIEYHITGNDIDENAVVRSIELSAERYCPAQAMFANVFPMKMKYTLYEDEGNNLQKIVKSGEYSRVVEPV